MSFPEYNSRHGVTQTVSDRKKNKKKPPKPQVSAQFQQIQPCLTLSALCDNQGTPVFNASARHLQSIQSNKSRTRVGRACRVQSAQPPPPPPRTRAAGSGENAGCWKISPTLALRYVMLWKATSGARPHFLSSLRIQSASVATSP